MAHCVDAQWAALLGASEGRVLKFSAHPQTGLSGPAAGCTHNKTARQPACCEIDAKEAKLLIRISPGETVRSAACSHFTLANFFKLVNVGCKTLDAVVLGQLTALCCLVAKIGAIKAASDCFAPIFRHRPQ